MEQNLNQHAVNATLNVMLKELHYHRAECEDILEEYALIGRRLHGVPLDVQHIGEPTKLFVDTDEIHEEINYTLITMGIHMAGVGLMRKFEIPMHGAQLENIKKLIVKSYQLWMERKKYSLGEKFDPKIHDPFVRLK
jgi:hypothetical protein